MRIDQNGGVLKDNATPDEERTKDTEQRKTQDIRPAFAQFFSVPQLSTFSYPNWSLAICFNQIDQVISNS